VKIAQGIRVYIPDFSQISVKISILGVLHPCRCTDGVKFGFGPLLHAKFLPYFSKKPKFGGGPSSMPNFTPIGATCRPCGGEKPQNRPLSKLNTGRYALRAMLPVNIKILPANYKHGR